MFVKINPANQCSTLINKWIKTVFFLLALTILYIDIYPQSPKELYQLSLKAKKKGDFVQAEKHLLNILKNKQDLKENNLIAVYNRLGILSNLAGKYEAAITYYQNAEQIVLNNPEKLGYKLSSINNNLGLVFKNKNEFERALQYFNASITETNLKTLKKEERIIALTHAYNNIGIVYFMKEKFNEAKNFYNKSVILSEKHQLEGRDINYLNLANSLRETGEFQEAEKYYKKSITIKISKYGKDYYKLASVYKSYARLKVMTKNYRDAYTLYEKSLNQYHESYGKKHPYTADTYELIGDYYLELNNLDKALESYQHSIVANSIAFNSNNIHKNPEANDVFSDIQLLHSLKKKAQTLLLLAKENKQQKEQSLTSGLSCIDLALNLIDSLRSGYLSVESKLFITKNEKEFYLTGIESALQLYELKENKVLLEKAYEYSRLSKAALLANELKLAEAFSTLLPDSLKQQKTEMLRNLASLKKLITDEYKKKTINLKNIEYWQSELFQVSQSYEKLITQINTNYPHYKRFIRQKSTPQLYEIQEKLGSDQLIIEYSYSLEKSKGTLYTFVAGKNKLNYYYQSIDSTFEMNLDNCFNLLQDEFAFTRLHNYNRFHQKLYELYQILLAPLDLKGAKNIIIVPDEEIVKLSFDHLVSQYKEAQLINFINQPYLLYQYNFSSAYSSTLLFEQTHEKHTANKVHAFAPSYSSSLRSELRSTPGQLKNASREIEQILNYFDGDAYKGKNANKHKFKEKLKENGICHLALHANSSRDHPDYAYMAFTTGNKNNEETRLYNYEISGMHVNSSMLVLSACNTGDGKIYSGEEVMSISRSFLMAGVPAVVHTLWKVNDETSATIMGKFYEYLAEGKSKSEALRLAKIAYIKNSSPEQANPMYWSGFVLTGDCSPVVEKNHWIYWTLGIALLFIIPGIIYRKRLRRVQ